MPWTLAAYLTLGLWRAAAALTLAFSSLIIAVDALDPSARSAPLSESLGRAPSLLAVALVVATVLTPAVALSSWERSGALRAMRSQGCRVGLWVAALSLLLAVPLSLGAQSLSAVPVAPGERPAPLAVTPFGAPQSGRWNFSHDGARFEDARKVGTAPAGRSQRISQRALDDRWFREEQAAVPRGSALRGGDGSRSHAGLWASGPFGALMVAAELALSDANSLGRSWVFGVLVLALMVALTVLRANAQ